MSRLSIQLLGPFAATLNERPIVQFRTRYVKALLIYLVCQQNHPHQREYLMTTLWPGLPEASAKQNLRQTLYLLRKSIPKVKTKIGSGVVPFILSGRQTIQISPEALFELDVANFSRLLAGDKSGWPQAVSLYRGDFLSDFYLPESNSFEEWSAGFRADLRRKVMEALTTLTTESIQLEKFDIAEYYAQRQLSIDNLHEPAYQQLMVCMTQTGRRHKAVTIYQTYRYLLQKELGLEPSGETRTLYNVIHTGKDTAFKHWPINDAIAPLSDSMVETSIIKTPKHNLTQHPTIFVGRETELDALENIIANPNIKLITIVGPGGVGKTTLALALAHRIVASTSVVFTHGIHLLRLEDEQTARSSETLATAIANLLSIPLANAPNPEEHLLYRLDKQEILLILDNGEHLSQDSKHLISRIMHQTKSVKILVASRVYLNLMHEQIFELSGLDFPVHNSEQQKFILTEAFGEIARHSDSVRLFCKHVTRLNTKFSLEETGPRELAAIVRICQLVEGLPLAIELSAGWTQVLAFSEIAQQLAHNIDILSTNATDFDHRHQSVYAVFEQSWRKLTMEERTSVCRLAVFRSTFSLDAVKTVTQTTSVVLKALVSKSLLQTMKKDGQIRFQMHPLLRQYAIEKLEADPVIAEETRRQHASYYSHYVSRKESFTTGVHFQPSLIAIGQEIENIRAGWNWAVEEGHIPLLDRYSRSMAHFYMMRGWPHEGREMFLSALCALDVHGQSHSVKQVQMRLMSRLASFNYVLSLVDEAEVLLQESLAFSLTHEDKTELEYVYRYLGLITYQKGCYAAAIPYLQQSIELAEEFGNNYAHIRSLLGLGIATLAQGDYDSFAKYIRHAKKLSERENHDWGLAHSYRFLGIMAHINEDYEQAKHLHQRSLEISQQIGDQLGIATAWNNLGRAAQAQGKCDLALELYQKGLTYAQTLPYHLGVVLAACNAGMVHLQQESLMNAANSFVVALETALAIKTIPGMMHIFACIAGLLGHASWLGYDQMSALQLLLIANYHPTTHHETRRQVTAFLAQYDFTPPSEPPTWLEISYILDKANEVLVSIRQHISKNEID